MATVNILGTGTWVTTGGDTTVTATPTAQDLIVVIAGSTGLAGGTTAVSDNNSDGKGQYIQVDQDRTGFSTTGVLTVWIRGALVQSATSTVFTASQGGSSGGGLVVLRVTGMSIAGKEAVRRIGVATYNTGGQSSGTAATTPAPVMGAAVLTANPVIMAVCNGTNSTTTVVPRASFTERFDNGYNAPATGLEVSTRDSGETGTTLTMGGTTASTFASVAVELDTGVPIIDYVVPGRPKREKIAFQQGAVGRASQW